MRYVPCGVVAVIAPWELPGSRSQPGWLRPRLATGNSVVLKPAEQAPGCAAELVAAFRAAGDRPRPSACSPVPARSVARSR